MKFYITSLLLLFTGVVLSQEKSRLLPESQINIPILIDLKPIYQLAEKNVAAVFTSPNYPNDWVESDCTTRYKYHFRRSPFRMNMNGNVLDLAFTGSYKIVGSTRACLNGSVLSPWAPSCKCGFDEGERKVLLGYTASFNLLPNYTLVTKVSRNEPKAVNKCEVCFWGHDVTTSVMKGLKTELDLSRKAIEDSFGMINLKPYLNMVWQQLSAHQSLPGLGYFNLQPKAVRMDNIKALNNVLQLNIGITANPIVLANEVPIKGIALPNISGPVNNNGFDINLEAALKYDSLSTVLTSALHNKRIDLTDGLIKKHIIIESTSVSARAGGDLQIKVAFSGSFKGEASFNGIPVYNSATQSIEVKNLEYDLQTKNFLLNTAKWLFNQKIKDELSRFTQFDLSKYYNTATISLNKQLNKEWIKGVSSKGEIIQISVLSLDALPDQLLIRSNAKGKLSFNITGLDLALNYR